jgi:hypothetical protein
MVHRYNPPNSIDSIRSAIKTQSLPQ